MGDTSNPDEILIQAHNGNKTLAFHTNDTQAMQLNSSGDLGIGGSPAGNHKLEVTGSMSASAEVYSGTMFQTVGDRYWSFRKAGNDLQLYSGSSGTSALTIDGDSSDAVAVTGAFSKGSGSFKIDHPLPAKTDTHHLIHSFVEAPKADLIYRGTVDLADGSATVNIDTAAGMTEGTFVLLCDDVQCFTTNEDNWDLVKASVSGNILTIESQNVSSTATISWMVIGDRKDQHMLDTAWTDENGKVIVEPEKVIEEGEE